MFEPIHTCQSYLTRNDPRTVPSKVIATFFSKKLLNAGAILKPKEMMAELKREFAIEVHYSVALRARNMAIEMIYGAYDKSYQMLPGYLYMLKQRNPGTVYDLHTADDDRFMYMFLALGVSISAWSACMRPVIVVDGTHLKGKTKGVLFVAVTKDGNEQCFPLAVGISHIENDESWIWFLTRLRSTFGQSDDLLIVSDQHSSFKNAIETVYPNVAHGFCYYHIVNKLARFGAHVAAMFQIAANTYRDEAFQKYWLILADASREGAYKKLMKVGIRRWARSQCPVRRFSFMTSNAAESFNGRLLWARWLPICSLIEVIRNVIEKWFAERRSLAYARDHQLIEEADTKVSLSVKKGLHFEVRASTTKNVFKVEDKEDRTYVVDLDHKTCECREFQLDLIPCSHAAAAIRWSGRNIYDYVEYYYKQLNLQLTYHDVVMPLPHRDEWILPCEISSFKCIPPVSVLQAGRPKVSRNRRGAECSSSRRRRTCSKCNEFGHNKAKCILPSVSGYLDLNESLDVPQPTPFRRRKAKKCRICHESGHTKPTCPIRPRDESD